MSSARYPTTELCQGCGIFVNSTVYDSRIVHRDRGIIWRRRKCPNCNHRWTTYECRDRPAEITWEKKKGRRNIVAMRLSESDLQVLQALPGRTTTAKLRNALRSGTV